MWKKYLFGNIFPCINAWFWTFGCCVGAVDIRVYVLILNVVMNRDVKKQIRLENCFVGMAREIVFECMVYV